MPADHRDLKELEVKKRREREQESFGRGEEEMAFGGGLLFVFLVIFW